MAPFTDTAPADLPATLHATAVCHQGQGLLICGPSGSGKSSLALQMMALGAGLIADDMVVLSVADGALQLSAPDPSTPRPFGIEARGLGLLAARPAGPAPLGLIVDLAQTETTRLLQRAQVEIGGFPVALAKKVENPAFPAMLMQYLSHGVLPT